MNHCWKYYASTQLAMTVFKFQDLLNSRCFRVYQYLSINDQKKKKKRKEKKQTKWSLFQDYILTLGNYRRVEFCRRISNLIVFKKFPWTRWNISERDRGYRELLKWSLVIGALRNRFINIIWIKRELPQLIFLYELLQGRLPVRLILSLILPRWVWLKLPCITRK